MGIKWVCSAYEALRSAYTTSVRIPRCITHIHLVLRSKNVWSCNSTPSIRLHGMVLSLKHRDNFTFTLYLGVDGRIILKLS
jgi:hypothetical protein